MVNVKVVYLVASVVLASFCTVLSTMPTLDGCDVADDSNWFVSEADGDLRILFALNGGIGSI